MGSVVGNVLALVAILVSAGFGYVSFELALVIFLSIAYGLWLIILGSDLVKRPDRNQPFSLNLDEDLFKAYRRYHVAIDFPIAGEVYAALLNMLRVSGLVWGSLCLWKALYFYAAPCFALFFVTGNLIVRNNPWFYMGRQAENGQLAAKAELVKIQNLIALMDKPTPEFEEGKEPNTDS